MLFAHIDVGSLLRRLHYVFDIYCTSNGVTWLHVCYFFELFV